MKLIPESKNSKKSYPSLKKYLNATKKIIFSAVSIGVFLNPMLVSAEKISKPYKTKGIMVKPTPQNDFQKEFKENLLELQISLLEEKSNTLSLKAPKIGFKVTIKNSYPKKLKIWSENNSWGYDNLYFEIKINEKIYTIKPKVRDWDKNAPTDKVISSKSTFEREVLIDSENWEGFPDKISKKSSIKAIFEIKNDEKSHIYTIWNGKIESNSLNLKIVE